MSARRVRVLFVIDKLQRAGAQVHLGRLAGGLDRERFEPEVVCLLEEGPVAEELREAGVPVEVLGLGRLYAPRAIAGLPRLVRRLRQRRPDVVHTYLVSSNIYGVLAGRLARVPAVVTSRRDPGFSRNWRLRLLEERLINPFVDRVVVVSSAVAESARREHGLRPDRILTIENGVDLAVLDPGRQDREGARREWRIADGEAAIGVIGHLSPVKGQADFLRAAARVAAGAPQARFVLVGDGPLRSSLAALAAELGIAGRVVFTGVREDVPRLLAMLDVVVVPSHTEGMSNALLEAMAMARPVVATAVGGNLDVVRDGLNGRLVPPRDASALASTVLELLANPATATRLGATARRFVAENLSLERMVRRYEELYQSLAGS